MEEIVIVQVNYTPRKGTGRGSPSVLLQQQIQLVYKLKCQYLLRNESTTEV